MECTRSRGSYDGWSEVRERRCRCNLRLDGGYVAVRHSRAIGRRGSARPRSRDRSVLGDLLLVAGFDWGWSEERETVILGMRMRSGGQRTRTQRDGPAGMGSVAGG